MFVGGRMGCRARTLKSDTGAEGMGGVITCTNGVFRHKSTEVDDESPVAAVDVNLLPLTSMLLPLKCSECSLRATVRRRAAGFMKGNSCTVLSLFYYIFQGKVSRSSAWWELDTGSRTGSR